MSTAKDEILDAAASMFYDQGINSTGINSIIARANVAKMSLYNHFPTKADLVSAYIAARHQEWLDLYAKRAAAIVKATTHFNDPAMLVEASRNLGEAMVGINVSGLPDSQRMAGRGW